MQVMGQLLGGEVDFEKIAKVSGEGSSSSDLKASVAALNFILTSAARYDVEDSTLTNELQQLGLPKEHADSLCRPYQEQKEQLRERFARTSLRFNRVEKLDWRVDYVVSSSKLKGVEAPSMTLKLKTAESGAEAGAGATHSFECSADKFAVLYAELKEARRIMDTVG